MAIEKVKEYFSQYGMEDRILEFEVSSATVELAAKAVGVEGQRIAKTLSFLVNEGAVLIVVAGDARIDNKKFKECAYEAVQKNTDCFARHADFTSSIFVLCGCCRRRYG